MNYLTDFRFWVLTIFVGILAYWLFTKIFKDDHPAEHPTEDKKGGGKTDPHKKEDHEDDHDHAEGDGHPAGGHHEHHHHTGFIVGVLKLSYVWIPGVIFLWCVFIPWSCKKQHQYQQEAAGIYPTPNYMQFKVNADIVGTGLLSTYIVSAYGPDHCRFDSVYNDGMFFDWNPVSGEGTCGYYGGGTGKLKVESFTKPTPLTFLVMAKRQKQENKDEWEVVKLEGKSSL